MTTPDDLEPLSGDLARLLDAERPLSAAPAGVKARLHSRLSADLFDVPPPDGGGTASQPPVAEAIATKSLVAKAVVAKLVVASSVVSLAVGGVIGATGHALLRPAPAPIAQPAPPPPVPAKVEVPPPPPSPAPVAPAPPVPNRPLPPPPPAAPRLTPDEALALERSYVEQARAALARQNPTSALEALAEHARRFPSGQLAEERLALEVMALTSAGRSDEARSAAARFRQRFPTGLFRSTVDALVPE